jgi:hypothetical protein
MSTQLLAVMADNPESLSSKLFFLALGQPAVKPQRAKPRGKFVLFEGIDS